MLRSHIDAEVLYNEGQFASLVDDFALNRLDGQASTLVLAGRAALNTRHYLDATAALQIAVDSEPANGTAWDLLGRAWYGLRQTRMAFYAFERADALGSLSLEGRWKRQVLVAATSETYEGVAAVREVAKRLDQRRHFPDMAGFIPDSTQRLPTLFTLGEAATEQAVLTIDDGPHPNTTPVLLELLMKRGIKVMFFVLGRSAERHPELIDAMLAHGHSVYNHSWSHTPYTYLDQAGIAEELGRTEAALSRHRATPSPYILRLPGGQGWTDPTVHAAIRGWRNDAVMAHWSVDSGDWRAPKCFGNDRQLVLDARIRAAETVLNPSFSAPIILAHDGMSGDDGRFPGYISAFYRALLDALGAANIELVLPTEQALTAWTY